MKKLRVMFKKVLQKIITFWNYFLSIFKRDKKQHNIFEPFVVYTSEGPVRLPIEKFHNETSKCIRALELLLVLQDKNSKHFSKVLNFYQKEHIKCSPVFRFQGNPW